MIFAEQIGAAPLHLSPMGRGRERSERVRGIQRGASIVTKSTMYRLIGCCRRNFQWAKRRPRNACHNRVSALVCDARSLRALFLKRCIPLTRLLRSRPLPQGERYSRMCGAA